MINSGSIQKQSPYVKILTDDQIHEIRRSAFDVMATAGFKVLHKGALKMLKKAGAVVKGNIVKVPEFFILRHCGVRLVRCLRHSRLRYSQDSQALISALLRIRREYEF